MNILFLNEHRCKCGKLLLKGVFFDGTLEIKCKRCGEMNIIGNTKLIDDGIHYLVVVNENGIIINGSDSACYILGYSRDELIGKQFTQINPTMPEEIREKFFGLKAVLNEENYFQLDTFHQSKSGKNIPVVVLLKLYQPIDKEKYLLVIAESKNTESKSDFLKKDEFEFLDNACDFYFDIDKKGISEYVSLSAENFFGLPQEKIIGKNYFDCLPLKVKDGARKVFEYFSANGQPHRIVHDIGRNINGENISSEIYFTPKFNDVGMLVGYRALGWVIKPKDKESMA
jgi:PAS domain S-box-containing protein